MGVQGLYEPEIIQGGRPQVSYDRAHVRDRSLGLVAGPIEQLADVAAGTVAGSLDRERDPGQGGSKSVMEIPPNAATLLLARVDDPLARMPDLGCESKCIERRRDLANEQV